MEPHYFSTCHAIPKKARIEHGLAALEIVLQTHRYWGEWLRRAANCIGGTATGLDGISGM
jgi:hypothetical protein